MPKIAVLIASLVNTITRRRLLDRMLASVTAQHEHADKYILCLRGPPELTSDLDLPSNMTVLRASDDVDTSQCLQLRAAWKHFMANVDGDLDWWIMFSDDDDLWHPGHIRQYAVGIRQLHNNKSVTAVRAKAILKTKEMRSTFDEHLDCANVSHDDGGAGIGECYMYAVRPWIIGAFFRTKSTSYLEHRYADVGLARFIREWGGKQGRTAISTHAPTYLYYEHDDSITGAVESQDLRIDRALRNNVELAVISGIMPVHLAGLPIPDNMTRAIVYIEANRIIHEMVSSIEGIDRKIVQAIRMRLATGAF